MPSPDLKIQRARKSDIAILARLNKQLLEDERSRYQPELGELEARMAGWLSGVEWSVDLFTDAADATVGYIVHGRRFNPSAPGGDEIYVRQFVIDRARRREGIGRAAMRLFLTARCVPGIRVMLDVLETNPAGRAFWDKIGFQPFATILETTAPRPEQAGDQVSDPGG